MNSTGLLRLVFVDFRRLILLCLKELACRSKVHLVLICLIKFPVLLPVFGVIPEMLKENSKKAERQ